MKLPLRPPLGACSGRPGWQCSWLPCSPPSPSVLRPAGWRRGTRQKFDTPAAHARASPIRCSRRSRAGTPSGTCASPTRATATARRARRSSRSTRCWCGRWPTPFGASPAALLVAAYVVALARVPRRALTLLYRLVVARAGPAARPARAAAARGVPGRALLRGALLGEPVPAAVGGRLLRRAHRPLGLGGRLRRRGRGHAQRGRAADAAAGDPVVELARAPTRATPPGCCSRRSGWRAYALFLGLAEGDALRSSHVQEAWYRELSLAARRRLGRARRGHGRRAPAALGPARGRLLRAGRRRPVPDRRDQPDAVRRRCVFARGGLRRRAAAAAARLRRLRGGVAGAAAERSRSGPSR